VAKGDDVIALAESAGIDTTTLDFEINHVATRSLIEALSPTVISRSGALFAVGFLDELTPIPSLRRDIRSLAYFEVIARQSPTENEAGLLLNTYNDTFLSTTGVMLYRNVPEPATLTLWVVGISALLGAMRRRQPRRCHRLSVVGRRRRSPRPARRLPFRFRIGGGRCLARRRPSCGGAIRR